MLIGEFEGKLAEKNRIALPKFFREQIKKEIYITRGYESCLIILDKGKWESLILKIEEKPFLNRSVRDTKRFLAGGASEILLDTQGRFVLPESLKIYANLVKEVKFVGVLDWIEIWDSNSWELKINELTKSSAEIADRLGEL